MATSSSETLVVAYFNQHSDAENAVRDLQKAGFRSNQIGTSYKDYDADERDLSADSARVETEDHRSFWQKIEDFFSGEHHDQSTSDLTDRNSDWSPHGLSVPDRYREGMDHGGELVSVRPADRQTEATEILTRNNGQIETDYAPYIEHPATAPGMGQGTRADITGGSMTPGLQAGETRQGTDRGSDTGERRIQLISEVLRVRKDRVSSGEVRLRKEVHTETQNVQVPLTREEIVIERSPVEGERTATGRIGDDSEIRVPLSEERVEVEKVPVVTEEVRVGKRPVSETQTVRDQVRREELEVEGADKDLREGNSRKTA